MLTFIDKPQAYPDVAEAAKRKLHWQEIYSGFSEEGAKEQADRCSQCGIPFCQIHCPLQNNIPDWLRLTSEGRLKEAYMVSSATNTFPEICGRICPQDRLCEGNCVIEKGFGAVTIGSIEKYITENAFEEGWVEPIRVTRETGVSIGIIGAGPAGLAAADMLRRKGHSITVYDRYDRVGGLLIYGIPNFKLDKSVVSRRAELLKNGGIQFALNSDIGGKISFADIRKKHDVILIATGVYKARELVIPNASLDGIVPALAYLTASNKNGLDGGKLASAFDAKGKRVVVIGGGDTAMDCVRTSVRQGAESVTCLYRRDRANMPGSQKEVKNAEEEGVKFAWLTSPKAYLGNKKVEGLLVENMRLLTSDVTGRKAVVATGEEPFTEPCDMAIEALGFDAEDMPTMFNEPSLDLTPYGTLKINNQFMTSLEGVFAAGDIVRGASLVVWAIRDGRDAADAMQAYLSQGVRRAA